MARDEVAVLGEGLVDVLLLSPRHVVAVHPGIALPGKVVGA